ncbi:MAG TPA: cupredoxin domain-containing protein [Chloroflexota bacterium]
MLEKATNYYRARQIPVKSAELALSTLLPGWLAAASLLLAGCGGAALPPTPTPSRAIVISSTDTPGPLPAASGPAAPVSTVLTPFATSTPGASVAASAAPQPAATPGNQVRIQDFSFTPPVLGVTLGTQVTWTNGGPSNHTVTANDGSFESGAIQRNANFSFTFSKAGTFAYHCSFHPTMQATVVVT